MVRIAHISDSHLGSSMFQLVERREDARKCFEKAIDMAIRKSPDILVHTGDLFHDSLPQNDDRNFVIKVFKKLQEKNVDIFVLQGNHDHPYGFRYDHSPLIGLETMGLINSTGEKPYRGVKKKYDGKPVEIHLLSWTSERMLNHALHTLQPKEDIALFFAHYIPNDIDLPLTFDYFGSGHKHTFRLDKEQNHGRPGSTCYVKWETESKGTKKLIVADVDSSGCEYDLETLNEIRATSEYIENEFGRSR